MPARHATMVILIFVENLQKPTLYVFETQLVALSILLRIFFTKDLLQTIMALEVIQVQVRLDGDEINVGSSLGALVHVLLQ